MKEFVVKILKNAIEELELKVEAEKLEKLLETPPSSDMGDFAFPCFALAKEFRLPPHQIALEIRAKIGDKKEFSKVLTQGPYINFFLDRKKVAKDLIEEIKERKNYFGTDDSKKKIKSMVEFCSPNTNKPLHLGHMRNMAIGESVARIQESKSEKVIRANLNNDRGTHICKSMLAYQKWGKNEEPSKKLKSDHLVGKYYVKFNTEAKTDESLEGQAQEMLQKWEKGDKKVRELWKKMNTWAFDGFKETFEKFGIKHDKEYYESEIYKDAKEIIKEGLDLGIFQKDKDGAVFIDLEDEKLGKKYLLRADGTSIYITQDIYLAKLKFDEFKINKSIYVVGNEQEHHFRVLFSIIDKLRLLKKENLFHLSYGMVNLPEGRMKSREGTVVDADNLISETQKLVKKELKERAKLDKDELEKRSLIIALAAIKYMLLKIDSKKNMLFNPKESIAFEGDTGPYLLYSYARANSILNKSKIKASSDSVAELEPKEAELIVKLNQFSSTLDSAYTHLNPALIANYAHTLAQTFNEFYHACPVIGNKNAQFRIALVESFMQVLKNSLRLLGIDVLEEM